MVLALKEVDPRRRTPTYLRGTTMGLFKTNFGSAADTFTDSARNIRNAFLAAIEANVKIKRISVSPGDYPDFRLYVAMTSSSDEQPSSVHWLTEGPREMSDNSLCGLLLLHYLTLTLA